MFVHLNTSKGPPEGCVAGVPTSVTIDFGAVPGLCACAGLGGGRRDGLLVTTRGNSGSVPLGAGTATPHHPQLSALSGDGLVEENCLTPVQAHNQCPINTGMQSAPKRDPLALMWTTCAQSAPRA